MKRNRSITQEEYIRLTYSQGNRREDPNAVAPATPQEYIQQCLKQTPGHNVTVSQVPGLGLGAGEVMDNVPLWLGTAPEIRDIAYELDCQVLVIGGGPAGSNAALRCAELGADVLCLERQTWEEYDAFACDMATYNSKFFLDRGAPEYDLMEVYNEYMRKALGHAHPKLVRDYAMRSGEMMDWMLGYIPQEYIDKYAHATQIHGNRHFSGEACGQKSFIGMLQWRDQETNCNVWPFVMRSLHQAAVERYGARFVYGAQAIRLVQGEDGGVIGCIAQDIEGKYFRVNCKAAVAAAGDFGGNPDMRLDLSDTLRNLAWSIGLDRTDPKNTTSGGGRDGSGIRMCLWAGARMEAGPRAGQDACLFEHAWIPFGGCWTTFGPDGKRFMNETLIKFGTNDALNMLPPDQTVAIVVDSDWDANCEYQGYGHEVMDRSNEHMLSIIRRDMANYRVGPQGFDVHNFSRYGESYDHLYAADTIEELGGYLGYTGDALANFVAEVEHWNQMCDAGYDSDWGCDKQHLFHIRKAPFFGVAVKTGGLPSGGLCQHGGVCTDGNYRVLNANKEPIPGLYAVGNCCGQRYGIQYHTPTSGNSCGSAMTSGYVAAECIVSDLTHS